MLPGNTDVSAVGCMVLASVCTVDYLMGVDGLLLLLPGTSIIYWLLIGCCYVVFSDRHVRGNRRQPAHP